MGEKRLGNLSPDLLEGNKILIEYAHENGKHKAADTIIKDFLELNKTLRDVQVKKLCEKYIDKYKLDVKSE